MVCSIGLGLQQEGISFGVGWEWMSPSLPESGWWILSPWADLQLSGWCWNWMVFFAGDTQTLHTKGCSLQCSPVMLWHAVYPPLTSIIIVSWDVVVDLTQVHVTGCRYFLVTIFGLCGTAKLTANLNSQYISLKLLWSSSVVLRFPALYLSARLWCSVPHPEWMNPGGTAWNHRHRGLSDSISVGLAHIIGVPLVKYITKSEGEVDGHSRRGLLLVLAMDLSILISNWSCKYSPPLNTMQILN